MNGTFARCFVAKVEMRIRWRKNITGHMREIIICHFVDIWLASFFILTNWISSFPSPKQSNVGSNTFSGLAPKEYSKKKRIGHHTHTNTHTLTKSEPGKETISFIHSIRFNMWFICHPFRIKTQRTKQKENDWCWRRGKEKKKKILLNKLPRYLWFAHMRFFRPE